MTSTAPDGRWHPGIGDPDITGGVTVLEHALAMGLCALCAARTPARDRRRRVWGVLAVLMLSLGINKQLDLQTWFTEVGRDLAQAQGWYARRQTVQVAFVVALALCGAGGSLWLWRLLRAMGSELRWAALGLIFLMVFVVTRAASFHHVDRWLGIELGRHVRVNAVLELSGIGIIVSAAAVWLRRLDGGRALA